jgi:hypothetical protein
MTLENLQFIISIATLLGFVFIAYRTFRDPDISADKSIFLLKDQIQYERKITDQTLEIHQNCLRSLEKEVCQQKEVIGKLNDTVIKLSTIIEERIPKK